MRLSKRHTDAVDALAAKMMTSFGKGLSKKAKAEVWIMDANIPL